MIHQHQNGDERRVVLGEPVIIHVKKTCRLISVELCIAFWHHPPVLDNPLPINTKGLMIHANCRQSL